MTETEWLASLKSGDQVAVESDEDARMESVSRVTDTQIIIAKKSVIEGADAVEFKYNRKTGERIGGNSWHPEKLVRADDALRERIKIKSMTREARRLVKEIVIPTDSARLTKFISALSKFQWANTEMKGGA